MTAFVATMLILFSVKAGFSLNSNEPKTTGAQVAAFFTNVGFAAWAAYLLFSGAPS